MALGAAQKPSPADEPAPADAALTRIRAKLARPERLKIAPDRELPEPTFRIEIRQHPYFIEVPFVWTFSGGGVPLRPPDGAYTGGTPLVSSGNLLPLFGALKHAIDQHAAPAEVQKAIAEFCATHICVIPQ